MLPITYKLLEQRLKEVDAEIIRVSNIYATGKGARIQAKELEQIKSYRKQVMKELEVIDQL